MTRIIVSEFIASPSGLLDDRFAFRVTQLEAAGAGYTLTRADAEQGAAYWLSDGNYARPCVTLAGALAVVRARAGGPLLVRRKVGK